MPMEPGALDPPGVRVTGGHKQPDAGMQVLGTEILSSPLSVSFFFFFPGMNKFFYSDKNKG